MDIVASPATAPERVANPFLQNLPAGVAPATQALATQETQRAREIAEVQAAIVSAKQCPRDEAAAMNRILAACSRPTLANLAVYQFTRGGDVSGPSIHLAKIIANAWGNIDYNWRILQETDKAALVQAVAWDLETNVRAHRTFTVSYQRVTRKAGQTVVTPLTEDRDRYECVANAAARRLRAAILDVIPADVTEAAVAQVQATQEAEQAKQGTHADRAAAMLAKFAAIGIDRATIETYAGRSIDALTPALFARLAQAYKAIAEGISAPEDIFGASAARAAQKPATRPTAPKTEEAGAAR